MRIFTHLSQHVQKFLPQPPQDVETGAQTLDLEVVHSHMVTFCLASAPAIALTYAQIHSKFSPIFHMVSFKFLLCVASFLVSKFMKLKFPVIARVLDLVSLFFAVTAFVTFITIPFPLYLQMGWGGFPCSGLSICEQEMLFRQNDVTIIYVQ
ncbi:hypothetical protein FH972_002609 [Carpinus fangiana]|uniref:Uncharacterized protein n=1 Tax=Carpinus fangiana TaxID=176857 RepID=A0A5N6QIU2_9ROSI|nr:hypothetical protein FH972_002609 [Carpinus fangiana]